MAKRDIIVIGGSTGSHPVLREMLGRLAPDLQASLFIVTHVPSRSEPFLAEMLARTSKLRVVHATDGQPIECGCVYVAVPDRHMLIIDGTIRFGRGPRENMTRPAIDPLFRSAALSYGSRTVGVLLSGLLNDGVAGLSAIKDCGGTVVVQHPLDAEADQMPLAALETVNADHVIPTDGLGDALNEISRLDAPDPIPAPEGLLLEVEIARGKRLGAKELTKIADPSALSCPDCGGVLSEMRDEHPLRYRCQIGHALTAEVLASRTEQVEEAMRVALRVMEERVTLVTRMAEDARRADRSAVAELYEARVEEFSRYAEILREAAIASLRTRGPTNQQTA